MTSNARSISRGGDVATLRAGLERSLEHVDGWLYVDEAWALHEAVRELPDGVATVVEIGSWKGRSTIALALAIQARGSGRVYAIDPHTGEKDRTGVGPVRTLADFRTNIARAGVESMVELLLMTSQVGRSRFVDESVDLLFVDGSHQYPDVKRDVEDWTSALKDGAIIAFNDPSASGVYRALRELVLRPGPYRSPRLVQNTLFFVIQRHAAWHDVDRVTVRRLRAVLWIRFQASRFWSVMPTWLIRLGHGLSSKLVRGWP